MATTYTPHADTLRAGLAAHRAQPRPAHARTVLGLPSSRVYRVVGQAQLTLGGAEVQDPHPYAADWTTTRVDAQTVDLLWNGYYLVARLAGTLIGGGRNVTPDQVGQPHVVTVRVYDYQADQLPYGLAVVGQLDPEGPTALCRTCEQDVLTTAGCRSYGHDVG